MPVIGYKKCQPIKNYGSRLIGIFELFEDTKIVPKIINEYSKFRINKCKLISVEDLSGNPVKINEIEPVRFLESDSNIIFKINEITETILFDDTENYIGNGIIMFLNKERAVNYLIDTLEKGYVTKWRDNGIIYSEENYSNFKRHGVCKYYHINGNIKEIAEYNYEHLINIQKMYDINGILIKTIDRILPKISEYSYKT